MVDMDDSAWLQVAMKLPVTASLGSMGPLLQKLHSFMASEEGFSGNDEIRLLEQGLKELCVSLKDLSEGDQGETSFTAKCWMKEVREICYDTEDNLDKPVDSGYSKLMARLKDAYKIRQTFGFAPIEIKHEIGQGAGISRFTPHDFSLQPLQGSMNKLVELLALEEEDKKLRVVTIFGSAGIGKTTAARGLYHQYGGKFQCRAFLRVSRNPNMRRLLTSILSQIKAPPPHPFSDVQDLIESIRGYLIGKRCLIVMDDLWASSTFDIISCAFPAGDFYGRIITTTQIEDVALACRSYHLGYIFKMRSPNDNKSGELLLSRVYYSESGFTNLTSKEAKEAYNNLSTHLKTCLLYLSVYPEGYTISKGDLVKQWVAEGFLSDVEWQDVYKIAGAYFDELVSRGMITPVDTDENGDVLSCTVQRMILDLIKCKSMEENFIIIVGYLQTTLGLLDKVRRLSVQFGDAKCANIPAGFRISQVRSLIYFGFLHCLPPIVDYKFLRVLALHIWADEDKIFDLTRIDELCRLRYLKIECNTSVELPAKIGGLRYLATLQVDTALSAVPPDIVQLQKLLHLRLPSESTLPDGVARMTSLRTLGCFGLGSNSENNVKDLGKLTNLQDLQLTCPTLRPAENLEKNIQLLGSVIVKLSTLQTLTLVPAAYVNILQDDARPSSIGIPCEGFPMVSPLPDDLLLHRIELSRRCCIFPSLPKWLGELSKLCILKIAVWRLSREDTDILKALPALSALSLYIMSVPADRIVVNEGEFPVLTYLKLVCAAPSILFLEGAMPGVRKLKLCFNANRMEQYSLVDAGLERLTGLSEITANIGSPGGDESDRKSAESALEAAVRNHQGPRNAYHQSTMCRCDFRRC